MVLLKHYENARYVDIDYRFSTGTRFFLCIIVTEHSLHGFQSIARTVEESINQVSKLPINK